MYRTLIGSLLAAFLLMSMYPVWAQEIVSAYYDTGVFAFEDGKYKEAEVAFKKTLESDSDNPSANHYLGKTYIKMERYKDARPFIEKAWNGDPELTDLSYDRAYLFYKLGNYDKAAEFFQEVLKEEPTRVMALFYGGISLYRDKQYEKANSYLLASADKSSELKVKAYYYSGLCHFYLGQSEQAVDRLTYAKNNTPSEIVRDNAQKWIEKIQGGVVITKPYQLEFKLAYKFDDNVPLGPDENDDSYSGESDSLITGYASGEYNFIDQGNLTLSAGLNRFQTLYFEEDQNNFSKTTGKIYGQYVSDPFSFGLHFIPGIYQLDNEDYLLIYEIKPEISYTVNQQVSIWLSYSFANNDYRQEVDDDRDGSTQELFLDVIYSLASDRGYVLAGVGYEDNTASEEQYDYNRLIFRAGGIFNLTGDLTMEVLGTHWSKEYKEDDDFDSSRYRISLTLTHPCYFDWLEIAGEYAHTNNDSNYNDDDFTRQLYGISLIATF